MGVLYIVLPLDAESRELLLQMGVAHTPVQNGRNPTPAELRSALATLPGFTVTFNDPPELHKIWQAMVEHAADPDTGGWTLLNMDDYRGEREPSAIWFEKGWPDLILTILVKVASVSGPLALVADTGDPPLLIEGSDDPAELYRRWEHTSPGPDGAAVDG